MYYSKLAEKFIAVDLGLKQIYTFDSDINSFLPDTKGVLIMANSSLMSEIHNNLGVVVSDFGIEQQDEIMVFSASDFS